MIRKPRWEALFAISLITLGALAVKEGELGDTNAELSGCMNAYQTAYTHAMIGQSHKDADEDGVSNREDNCPLDSNPNQKDHDGDDRGDICEDDQDGDYYPAFWLREGPPGFNRPMTHEETLHFARRVAWDRYQRDIVTDFTNCADPSIACPLDCDDTDPKIGPVRGFLVEDKDGDGYYEPNAHQLCTGESPPEGFIELTVYNKHDRDPDDNDPRMPLILKETFSEAGYGDGGFTIDADGVTFETNSFAEGHQVILIVSGPHITQSADVEFESWHVELQPVSGSHFSAAICLPTAKTWEWEIEEGPFVTESIKGSGSLKPLEEILHPRQ